MTLPIYNTYELLMVQLNLPPTAPMWWVDRFFTQEMLSDKEEIYFDEVTPEMPLAPFVAPNVAGRMMRESGYTTKSFKPAYLKPKHAITPEKALARMPGEGFGGTLSMRQRYDAHVANNLRMEREAIERRWNWMACQAVANGSVVVSGEDYPSQTVDFGRHSTLTYNLASGARWSQSTATPLTDIEAARANAFARGYRPVNTLVFGTTAWSYFISFSAVRDLLTTQYRQSQSQFNITPFSANSPVEYKGRISPDGGDGFGIELWVYSDKYTVAGSATDFLNPLDVVGVGDIGGIRCFGAIRDEDAGLQPMSMFPKSWSQPDPSARFTMTQSAPLMVVTRPNASFRIRTHQ